MEKTKEEVKEERTDPEANDPNKEPGPTNPVAITAPDGMELRFQRLHRKFSFDGDARIFTEEDAPEDGEEAAE